MIQPNEILEKYRRFVRNHPHYRQTISLDRLPLERYKVYEHWKPDTVRVLFLAESPPWKDSVYFYNEKSVGGLSSSVFDLLKIEGRTKRDKLDAFKKENMFLTDTIKCIFKKNVRKSIPDELIAFSGREILAQEIKSLAPRYILVLGSTALKGLKSVREFSSPLAKFNSITESCGESTKVGNTEIILSVFPNSRNRRYSKHIRLAFDKIPLRPL